MIFKFILRKVRLLIEIIQLPIFIFICFISKLYPKKIKIGLGPSPLINNVYHKKALIDQGYSSETYVDDVWFITNDFDYKFIFKSKFLNRIFREIHIVFLFSIFRYECLYLYFNGGPLHKTILLWRFEPKLYRIAGIRTVIMPYGGDVQDLTRTKNLLLRHRMAQDYPSHRFSKKNIEQKIDLWICGADHVISGCDWVEYMNFWHTLTLGHFSIDLKYWKPSVKTRVYKYNQRPFRILHAPNHRAIKGTEFFVKTVNDLKKEGELIELVFVEKLPNNEIKKLIDEVDLIADQLIFGWYAMFSLEGMSMKKPVICNIRDDLKQFYVDAGLIQKNEIPLINCNQNNLKSTLLHLMKNSSELERIGNIGRDYVKRHHSIDAVGKTFNNINQSIGVSPDLSRNKI
mgnify:CR=1 FL=1